MWSFLLLGEVLNARQMIGIAIVTGGLLVLYRNAGDLCARPREQNSVAPGARLF